MQCGRTDKLEVDHIDPSTKLFECMERSLHRWEDVVSELDKCQLLCDTCHGKKTGLERSYLLGLLDDDTLADIRGMLSLGIKKSHIADMYNLSRPTITKISNGEIYANRKGN